MQIHTPGGTVADGEFTVSHTPGTSFAVITLDPQTRTRLFMDGPGDCNRLRVAADLAESMLLGDTSEPVPAAIITCQHHGTGPLDGMDGHDVKERYLDGRGRRNLERMLIHISGYCPAAFLAAVSHGDAIADDERADHPFVSPGLVAPDRPAPDACMTCGLPRKPSHPDDDAGRGPLAPPQEVLDKMAARGMRELPAEDDAGRAGTDA